MIKFFLAYKMAIQSIFSNKVRSFLTLLGVVIGVAAVISAVALAQGSTKSITDEIESLGTNIVYVMITGRGSSHDITFEDFMQFTKKNSDVIQAVTPIMQYPVEVKYKKQTEQSKLTGTTTEYMVIQSLSIKSGRFILPIDNDLRQRVVVIGSRIVNELYKDKNPIGENIKLNGEVFKIVGVLKEREGSRDNSNDDIVIAPVMAVQRLMKDTITKNFAIKTKSPDKNKEVINRVKKYLSQIYDDPKMYTVYDLTEFLSLLNKVTGVLMLVLGGIATISLIVGGIGIMNIMLVSVTERTKEIGIRKAIGAKRRDILTQFLIEAVVVTGVGGVIGILFGFLIVRFVLSNIKGIQPVYSVEWATIAFLISLIIGVVFGLFPADKASRLNPIEALRYE